MNDLIFFLHISIYYNTYNFFLIHFNKIYFKLNEDVQIFKIKKKIKRHIKTNTIINMHTKFVIEILKQIII